MFIHKTLLIKKYLVKLNKQLHENDSSFYYNYFN